MAQLQTHYPTGGCTAQGHLDSIAALNEQLAALTPAEVNSPVLSRRKGVAGGVMPNPLPLNKLAVFLEQQGIVGGYNDNALTDPGDVLMRGYLCRAAILLVSTSNTYDWMRPSWTGPPPASARRRRCLEIQRCWARCRPHARG